MLLNHRLRFALHVFNHQPAAQADGLAVDKETVVALGVLNHEVAADAEEFLF